MSNRFQYLLVVYVAAQRRGEPISPGYVAEKLDRSPAATTEMLQRLESEGLLTYEPYEGVTLTAEGRAGGEELSEQYAIFRAFFRDILEVDDPEQEAMELAGSVSSLVTDRLVETVLEGDRDEILNNSKQTMNYL